jgi:hypothetical protein
MIGSIFVFGSNPNADFNNKVKFPTEYRIERLYPSYYNSRRPDPRGVPTSLSYGGLPFNISLSSEDLFGDVQNLERASVVIMRTGFSTHTLNMGQRMVVLESTYTGNADGSGTLHVSQIPPNPAILVPGPALCFVVVDGVPSVATQLMVGSGTIEAQKVEDVWPLPEPKILENPGVNEAGSSSHHGASAVISINSSPEPKIGRIRLNRLVDGLLTAVFSGVVMVWILI